MQAPALSVNRASGVGLNADVRVTPAALTVARADLNWQQANASLSGSVGLTGARPLNLVADANAVDIAALLRAADQPSLPASGTLAARSTISGTVTRPLAALTVQGSDLVAYDETFGSLNADVALAGPEITLSRLSVDKPQEGADGRIGGTGSYSLDRRSYTVDLQSQNVRLLGLRLPGGQRIRGTVELVAHGAGTVASPAGQATVTVDDLEIDGLDTQPPDEATGGSASQWGRVTIAATAANGQATLEASAPRFNTNADASIGLQRPWPAMVKVQANDLDLAALPIDLETPLTGRLRATVRGHRQSRRAGAERSHRDNRRLRRLVERPAIQRHEPFAAALCERAARHRTAAAGRGRLVGRRSSGALPLTDRAGLWRHRHRGTREPRDAGAVPASGHEPHRRRRRHHDRQIARHAEGDRSRPRAERRQRPRPVTADRAWPLQHPAAGEGGQWRRRGRAS